MTRPYTNRHWSRKRGRTLRERFMEKVAIGPACWEWQAAHDEHGYGFLGIRDGGFRGIRSAHRVSWELANGPIPFGMHVLHHCDNPGCVNPAHLFLGTAADNIRDMSAKGRNVRQRSPDCGPARLVPQAVVDEARRRIAAGDVGAAIARDLGISQAAVSRYRRGSRRN